MKLEQYAKTYIELHHKLNDLDYIGDINAEYKAFWDRYKHEIDTTGMFMSISGLRVSFHDAWVQDFSAKRQPEGYLTVFNVNAFLYDDTKQEVGRQKQELRIFTPTKLREISGRQIMDLVIDNLTGTLVIIYLDRNWHMKYVTCAWSACSRSPVGNFQEYA
jgi:hypothetical protein